MGQGERSIGGIETRDPAHQIVLLLDLSEVVVAHSEIKGKPRGNPEAILKVAAVIVLRSVSQRVSGVLEAAVHVAGQKVRKAGKLKSSAEIFVEAMLDAGPAKLKAELYVVLVEFPGKIVEQLVVGIHSGTRIARGGAQLCYPADQDNRQALIRDSRTCIQANRAGMKGLILREKSFGKPVPAIAQLIHFVRTNGTYIGKRYQLDPGWRHRIEAGQLTATGGQRQGKRLVAIAEVIAPSNLVAHVEAVVNLRNHAVDAVTGRRDHGRIEGLARYVGSGPGMPG